MNILNSAIHESLNKNRNVIIVDGSGYIYESIKTHYSLIYDSFSRSISAPTDDTVGAILVNDMHIFVHQVLNGTISVSILGNLNYIGIVPPGGIDQVKNVLALMERTDIIDISHGALLMTDTLMKTTKEVKIYVKMFMNQQPGSDAFDFLIKITKGLTVVEYHKIEDNIKNMFPVFYTKNIKRYKNFDVFVNIDMKIIYNTLSSRKRYGFIIPELTNNGKGISKGDFLVMKYENAKTTNNGTIVHNIVTKQVNTQNINNIIQELSEECVDDRVHVCIAGGNIYDELKTYTGFNNLCWVLLKPEGENK